MASLYGNRRRTLDPHGRIAQLEEHGPYKAGVAGSSPAPPTTEVAGMSGGSRQVEPTAETPGLPQIHPRFRSQPIDGPAAMGSQSACLLGHEEARLFRLARERM